MLLVPGVFPGMRACEVRLQRAEAIQSLSPLACPLQTVQDIWTHVLRLAAPTNQPPSTFDFLSLLPIE